jgi:hypothetical protein
MTKPKTLALAAACTLTGAGGALAIDAVGSSARPHHRRAHLRAAGLDLARRAVHVEAVLATKDGFGNATIDRGVVKSVSGQDLTVTDGTPKKAYQDVTIAVPADAVVRVGGRKATLADLKPAERVLVAQLPKRTLVLAGPGPSSR